MPHLDAAERTRLAVEAPQRAQVPYQALAHSLKDLWRDVFESRCLREHLGDGVLRHEALLGPLALGDVLNNGHDTSGNALRPRHQGHVDVPPDHVAILVPVALREDEKWPLCLQQLGDEPPVRRTIVFVREVHKRQRLEFGF
jgi:hypothetical protein